MTQRGISGLFAALLLAMAMPVAAQDFDTELQSAVTLYDTQRDAEALVILDALLARADLPADKGRVQQLRFFVLARLDRIADARAAIEVAVANNPEPPPAILAALFKIRAFMGDNAPAADTLVLLAASDRAALNGLPTELVGQVRRALREQGDRSFELDFALLAANWSPADATVSDLDVLRLRIIEGLVTRDRLEEARTLVSDMLDPTALVRVGIDRRFTALWPQVEARLGPGADIADAAFVAAAKARFDKAPDRLINRIGYANALNIASREPEALALLDVLKTPAELAALTEREIWAVDLHAALLADAGQIDAALARLAALNATPIAGRGWLISTLINEALLAEGVERPDRALAAADVAEAKGGAMASEFGKLYLAAARTCAQVQLGRKDAALAAAAAVIAAPMANRDAYLASMICLGRMDDAAKSLIAQIESEADRTQTLFKLQPFLLKPREVVRDRRERAALALLKARPDVKAVFNKYGRDLPAAVAPPR